MILFWLAIGVLSIVVVGIVLTPLLVSRGPSVPSREYDLAVYRDQLGELRRDEERGVISAEQSGAARVEIERRMLRAAALPGSPSPRETRRSAVSGTLMAGVLGGIVPTAGLLVYLTLGAPGLPDAPRDSRQTARPEAEEFARLTDRLAARMAENPEDARGWMMLGRSYRVLGRLEDSIAAFRRGISVAGTQAPADLFADLGEALVSAADGRVTQEAHELFLRAGPGNLKARNYLATERAQAGDLRGALAMWREIEAETPADAPWRPVLQQQIARISAQLGTDPVGAPPPVVASPAGPPVAAAPIGPGTLSPEAVAAAAQMAPEERQAFIRSMVERLAGRLAENPDDGEGWLRLARAYTVLGETDEARQAFGKAASALKRELATLPADSPRRAAIEQQLTALEGRS